MPDTVAFTGNRVYQDRAALYRGLDGIKADKWYFGGARGADTDALEYITKTQPLSTRVVVVPNQVIDQPRIAQAGIKRDATQIIELRNTGPGRYQFRNQYMVDRSQEVVAFTDGRSTGGTANTIRYAESKGVKVTRINWNGFIIENIVYKDQVSLMEFLGNARVNNIPMMQVKGITIRSLHFLPRSEYPAVLNMLHTLP